MLLEKTHKQTFSVLLAAKIADYNQFLKIRLSSLVIFSAVMGYLFASPSNINWLGMFYLALGGFLVVGASNGINQIIEKDSDKLMKRTSNRPVATGRMGVWEASIVALILGLLGVWIIASQFNFLSALLAFASLMSYAFVYTPFKKIHPIAVFIGAFPGALPIMIGYTAVSGSISFEIVLLFAIQFMWQFPHFWAIAWQLHDDYNRAGIKLLPNADKPNRKTAIQILIYTSTLIPLGLMLYVLDFTGIFSAIIATILAVHFTRQAWQLYKGCNEKLAKKLMFGSFLYLPLVQLAFVVERFLLG